MFNELFYRKQWRQESRKESLSLEPVLLSARRDSILEPHVRTARFHPISVCCYRARLGPELGAAGCSTCSLRTGWGLVPLRDQGLSGARSAPASCLFRALASHWRSISRCVTTPKHLIDALNERVLEEGGRVYLAKDSFTRREHFEAMEGSNGWPSSMRCATAGIRIADSEALCRYDCWETEMRVAILGATKGMGRAMARLSAERGDRICLLGRDLNDLGRSAADLRARGAEGTVACVECDLERPDSFQEAVSAARDALGELDTVVITAGIFATQDALETDPVLAERLIRINFTNTVMFCEAAKKALLEAGGGTLCVFSSVAGERGRKPVIIYGAAKAGLTRYLEGLDHKHSLEGLRVITVKPGFVKTSMTAGLPAPPFAGDPDTVAARVLSAVDRGSPIVYAPAPWRWIMTIIRALPRFVMRRIQF